MSSRSRLAGFVLASLAVVLANASLASAQQAKKKSPAKVDKNLDKRIEELINQLGARSYTSREKAKSALERLGLVAFDALNAAQHNADIEIAMRARYLVRRLRVSWSQDTDSAEIKRILRGYSGLAPITRKSRMDRLASLNNRQGTLVLCRLSRFETNDRLSKTAALLVMKQEASETTKGRAKLSEKIKLAMGRSKRPAASWLRNYAGWLVNRKGSLDEWEKIAIVERQVLARFPERSSRLIARDLYRWLAEELSAAKEEKRAIAMMRNTIQLLDGTQTQLLEITDWLMKRKAWGLIDEVVKRYQGRFQQDRDLLYRLAEAYQRRGDSPKAEELAKQAGAVAGRSIEHMRIAYVLQERGMFKWAEREYRYVLKSEKPASQYDQRCRYLLSEMLHDLKREKDAGDALLPVVTKIKTDKQAKQIAVQLGRHPGLESRMNFFYSLHYKSLKNNAKQIEHFNQGIIDDPKDPDLLIAMYRFKGGDAAFRKKTLSHLKKAIDHFRKQIKVFEEEFEETNPGPEQSIVKRDLALNNNQYAWLVSNTTGDYQHALRCSKRSLELRPKTPGYLDTLGRCYYAIKDYKNAVKSQSQAVKLDPHSKQIGRQLKLFQQALKEHLKK